MAHTLRVRTVGSDQHVILAEGHADHPGGEIFLAAFPDDDTIHEVGDTPGVRGKIASGELVEVGRGQAARGETAQEKADRVAAEKAAEKAEADRLAAEKAAQGRT